MDVEGAFGLGDFVGMVNTDVFDAALPTTSPLIRGQTVEEHARNLEKSGKTSSAGGMFRFLGNMMYNGEEMLLARKIAREENANKEQEKIDREEKIMDVVEKVGSYYRAGHCPRGGGGG